MIGRCTSGSPASNRQHYPLLDINFVTYQVGKRGLGEEGVLLQAK